MLRHVLPFLLVPAAAFAQQSVARITVLPASPKVVAGDTLRLKAEAVDAAGKAVPGVTIKFQQTAAQFEGTVDDAGLVSGGSVGTIPLAVTALVAGETPVIRRVEVAVLPGPAASISLDQHPARLLAGQSFRIRATVFSRAGDTRADSVRWSSSSDAVARVAGNGTITGAAPGKAVITASIGGVHETLPIEVVSAKIGAISISPSQPRGRTGDVMRFKASAWRGGVGR